MAATSHDPSEADLQLVHRGAREERKKLGGEM